MKIGKEVVGEERPGIKKAFAAMDDGGGQTNCITVKKWDGEYYRDGRRYGDDNIAEYFIKFDREGIPSLVKNEKFKPYRSLGWGGINPRTNGPGIDHEAIEVKEELGLDRKPTEEEIKAYFESPRIG